MPLVFVHGVNVREGAAYQREVLQRNRYLSNIFLKLLGRQLEPDSIVCPYWGDLATNLSPGNPFLPSFDTPVSTTKRLLNHLAHASGARNLKLSLLSMARKQPMEDVVDLMVAAAAENEPATTSAEAEQLSEFAFEALQFSKQFDDLDEQLSWLKGINSDTQFLGKLEEEIDLNSADSSGSGATESKKGLKRVRRAVSWMQDHWTETRNTLNTDISVLGKRALERAREDLAKVRSTARNSVETITAARRRTTTHLTAAAITHPIRKLVHDRLFLFIGDAFFYFGGRGTPESPGPIVRRIIDSLESAKEQVNAANDPELIVIAHSMGGNIVCDVLSHFATDRPIDLVITVGAQFPLFADLHMFPGLDTRNRPIAKPPNVKRWINIYDVNDVFGFAATPMFDGIEDFEFTSGRFGVATHADCFKFVSLYERMAQAVLHPTR